MGNLHFSLQVVASMIRCAQPADPGLGYSRGSAARQPAMLKNNCKAFAHVCQVDPHNKACCRMYDKDRSGTINFEEFQGLVCTVHADFAGLLVFMLVGSV